MTLDENTRTALRVALRHVKDGATTEAERLAVLRAMVTHLQGEECEAAAHTLFFIEQEIYSQTLLDWILAKPLEGESTPGGKDGKDHS